MLQPDPSSRWFGPALTIGVALAMIPIGILLVVLAGFLGTQVWPTGLGFVAAAVIGVIGAYMPYAGAMMLVFLVLFWGRVFYLERHKDVR